MDVQAVQEPTRRRSGNAIESATVTEPGTRPHILFVVLDTQRWDRMGFLGYARRTTPNLDRFADSATIYEHAVAPAQWTIPSHASMFTGEPPSVHNTVQSNNVLPQSLPTLAEQLSRAGYTTIGFCNNPLVGIVDNGLRRGFQTFHNYCGAFPAVQVLPEPGLRGAARRVWSAGAQLLHHIAHPIQDAFARSQKLFKGALSPFWVPIWTRFANFKGQNARSIRDVAAFAQHRMAPRDAPPHFLFLNLMETHFPHWPPERFARRFARRLSHDRRARRFVRAFNTDGTRWVLPLEHPLLDWEARTLRGMYDAEVAYQDHLLARLLRVLNQPAIRDRTMVIFVADHGEMLGEHGLVGHGLGAYEELIRVPLVIRSPGQRDGQRIESRVSTTRLYHTVLEAAGIDPPAQPAGPRSVSREASRSHTDAESATSGIVCESFPPEFVLQLLSQTRPGWPQIDRYRPGLHALYQGRYKLIFQDRMPDRLIDLAADPTESAGRPIDAIDERQDALRQVVASLTQELQTHLAEAASRVGSEERYTTQIDEEVQRRLRDLGYI